MGWVFFDEILGQDGQDLQDGGGALWEGFAQSDGNVFYPQISADLRRFLERSWVRIFRGPYDWFLGGGRLGQNQPGLAGAGIMG
jgi:hypothetical protein